VVGDVDDLADEVAEEDRGFTGGFLDQIALISPTQLSGAPRFYMLYQRRYEAETAL